MPNWLMVAGCSSGGRTQNKALTRYCCSCGYLTLKSTEEQTQFIARDSYTLSNLFVRVTTNTLDGAATVGTRKNTSNGNQSVSIGAGATGTFQDTTNTDSLVNGDLFNYQSVSGGTAGSIIITIMSLCLQSVNNTPILGGPVSLATLAGTTKYINIAGNLEGHDTEEDVQYIFRTAATLSNLYTYVDWNSLTTDTTVRTRVNGVNGNQLLTIPGGTSGAFEDAINTDSVSPGNSINLMAIAGTGTSLNCFFYQSKLTSLCRQTAAANGIGLNQAPGSTRYFVLEDTVPAGSATESDAQVITKINFVAQNLFVRIPGNNVDGSTTIGFRQNSSTNLVVSIPASTTGTFEDSSSVSCVIDDLLNYILAVGGSTGLISMYTIGFELAQPPAPPLPQTASTRSHFRHTLLMRR